MNILMIGATGFIGQAVVKQLALADVSLTLLVRNTDKAATLKNIAPEKVHLVKGDLTLPALGLSSMDKASVLATDVILHCGGPMDITLSQQLAKDSFLEGSKRVMDLAKEIHDNKGLKKFVHVVGYMSPFTHDSSIWEKTDAFKEVHPLLMHTPPYEQMKFLADIYIRQETKKIGIPLAVINPPTVIGDDQTGSTTQLEGFGLFIKTIRGGFLPVIPGGKNHRLPLINNNILATFITQTIVNESHQNMTYTLVADRELDHNLPNLMSIVTQSMNIKTPRFTLPLAVLKWAMTWGGSRFTGIPTSSLNFLTDQSFDNTSIQKNFNPNLVKKIPATNIPMAVADIDFRLTYPKEQIMPVWHRSNIQGITSYQLPGKNTPIVLLHGLFSDGSDLFNLGIELNQKTGRGIMIVDLPGLGRSPFQKGENTLDPYRQMIPAIKKTLPKESIFIGHSFGAALLIEAYAQQCLSNDDKVILLQPPINKVGTEPCPTLSKIILRTCSMRQLATYFHRKGLWLTHEAPNHDYLTRLKQSFRSPRILNTTLQLNQVLKKMNLDKKISPHFHVIWGTLDKSYTIPTEHKLIEKMPYGHYFPISHPNETANAIAKIINT